jgi:hypothetical protein
MKKGWPYAVGILLIGLVAAGVVAINKTSDHNSETNTSQTSSINSTQSAAQSSKQACKIFTLSEAKQVLGDSAKGGESSGSTSSDDLAVSTCAYIQASSDNTPIASSKSASLLVRAPKTGTGSASNQNQFKRLLPADAQTVAGYGQAAYWDPQFGQLNILKGNTWYVISSGPITPDSRTLDEAKQLADLLIDKM